MFATGKRVKNEVGDVTILVNNAGIVVGKKLLATPDDLIEKTFSVNLLGHFWVRPRGYIFKIMFGLMR